jgi:hypothetical protein
MNEPDLLVEVDLPAALTIDDRNDLAATFHDLGLHAVLSRSEPRMDLDVIEFIVVAVTGSALKDLTSAALKQLGRALQAAHRRLRERMAESDTDPAGARVAVIGEGADARRFWFTGDQLGSPAALAAWGRLVVAPSAEPGEYDWSENELAWHRRPD